MLTVLKYIALVGTFFIYTTSGALSCSFGSDS